MENLSGTRSKELLSLSKALGLDAEVELQDFMWFLNMLLKVPLPENWAKIQDPVTQEFFYYKTDENIKENPLISLQHPLINQFRGVFKEYTRNPVKTLKDQAFSQLQGKINSELSIKPVKKPNFTKKNGKTPALQDGCLALFEDGPGKSRFLALKQALNERKRPKTAEKAYILARADVSQAFLSQVQRFYEETLGVEVMEIYEKVKSFPGFFEVELDPLVEAIEFFNFSAKDQHLFWLARTYLCLPLPQGWIGTFLTVFSQKTQRNERNYAYVCEENAVFLLVHPGLQYIEALIARAKALPEEMKVILATKDEKTLFKDQFSRDFVVNLPEMLREKEKTGGNETNAERFVEKNEGENRETVYSDELFFEIARQLRVNLDKEIHLLAIVHEFLLAKQRKAEETWVFKSLGNGQNYWINRAERKAVRKYPYLEELSVILERFRKEIAIEYGKYLLDQQENEGNSSSYDDIVRYFKLKKLQQIILVSRKEAHNFLKFYLDCQLSKENQTSSSYTAKLLKKYLKKPKNITVSELQSIIFHSPFALSQRTYELEKTESQENEENIAIRFVNSDEPSKLNEKLLQKSGLLLKMDLLSEDFEEKGEESPTFSLQQIEEKRLDLMNNVILVIINEKYSHLSQILKEKLINCVEEDIRLILPYLLNLLDTKSDKNDDSFEDDKEDTHLLAVIKEIFQDSDRLASESQKEYNKKLLQTLEYRYFEAGLLDLFRENSLNFSLVRKINRFIFHKYREIILNDFIVSENLENFPLEDNDNEISSEIISSEKTSESELPQILINSASSLRKKANSSKNSEIFQEFPEEIAENHSKNTLDIASLREIDFLSPLTIGNSEEYGENPEKVEKFERVAEKKRSKIAKDAAKARKLFEKNHFMKHLVRMTMEEKKVRRRFADLMRRNKQIDNRLEKNMDDYTLEELKEAIKNLELEEIRQEKERKNRIKARLLERKNKFQRVLGKSRDNIGKIAKNGGKQQSVPANMSEKQGKSDKKTRKTQFFSEIPRNKQRISIVKHSVKEISKKKSEKTKKNVNEKSVKPLNLSASPIKTHKFLKRKSKAVATLQKAKEISQLPQEKLEEIAEKTENPQETKKVPIVFKFSPDVQFQDFYHFSEKNLDSLTKTKQNLPKNSIFNPGLKEIVYRNHANNEENDKKSSFFIEKHRFFKKSNSFGRETHKKIDKNQALTPRKHILHEIFKENPAFPSGKPSKFNTENANIQQVLEKLPEISKATSRKSSPKAVEVRKNAENSLKNGRIYKNHDENSPEILENSSYFQEKRGSLPLIRQQISQILLRNRASPLKNREFMGVLLPKLRKPVHFPNKQRKNPLKNEQFVEFGPIAEEKTHRNKLKAKYFLGKYKQEIRFETDKAELFPLNIRGLHNLNDLLELETKAQRDSLKKTEKLMKNTKKDGPNHNFNNIHGNHGKLELDGEDIHKERRKIAKINHDKRKEIKKMQMNFVIQGNSCLKKEEIKEEIKVVPRVRREKTRSFCNFKEYFRRVIVKSPQLSASF